MVIRGDSMAESYSSGEVVLIKKRYGELRRFDVVVAETAATGLKGKVIKRIIGLPNEKIQIIGGFVYINGVKLENDVSEEKMKYAGIAVEEISLADDEFFLLGDNRDASEDSRYEWLGIVKEEQILGVVIHKIIKK